MLFIQVLCLQRLEASIESIPSIGFSLLDYSIEADFTGAQKYAKMLVEQILGKILTNTSALM
jgi:hypothetical protein